MEMKIGFVGGGRVVRIFLQGFKNRGIKFQKVTVLEPDKKALEKLKYFYDDFLSEERDYGIFSDCSLIFLAVHPPVLKDCLEKLKENLKEEQIVVSLAPKIRTNKIQEILNGHKNVLRIIPNAPIIVNYGLNPLCFSKDFEKEKKDDILGIIGLLGKAIEVKEEKLEGYALISGMGPTYFWFQLKHLKELGRSFGLDEEEAKDAISYMLEGSAKTLFYSNIEEEEAMDLIPAKPLANFEEKIKQYYSEKLKEIYEKIKT